MAAACFALGVCGAARANPFDVYGFGPAGVASVGARAARATDGTATFYNPGGLGLGHGYRVAVGALAAASALKAQGRRLPITDPAGVTVAIDADVPLEGPLEGVLRFGYGGYSLPDSLMHLQTPARTDPVYPYYANRTQRLVVLPALAARVTDWLGVGVAANVFASLGGPASLAGGPSGGLEARIDEEAPTTIAAIAGVQAVPADWLRVGVVYREQFAVPIATRSYSTVGSVPLVADVSLGQAFFTPDTYLLAFSVTPTPRLALELDAAYERWGKFKGPSMTTRATLPGVALYPRGQPDIWRDIWSVRGAASYRLGIGRHQLVLDAGAGYEPSTQRDLQQGETNLLDGNKVLVGVGAELALHDVLAKHVLRFGAAAQLQHVGAFSQSKRVCQATGTCTPDEVWGDDPLAPANNITNPGYPALNASGSVWALSASVGVDL